MGFLGIFVRRVLFIAYLYTYVWHYLGLLAVFGTCQIFRNHWLKFFYFISECVFGFIFLPIFVRGITDGKARKKNSAHILNSFFFGNFDGSCVVCIKLADWQECRAVFGEAECFKSHSCLK